MGRAASPKAEPSEVKSFLSTRRAEQLRGSRNAMHGLISTSRYTVPLLLKSLVFSVMAVLLPWN